MGPSTTLAAKGYSIGCLLWNGKIWIWYCRCMAQLYRLIRRVPCVFRKKFRSPALLTALTARGEPPDGWAPPHRHPPHKGGSQRAVSAVSNAPGETRVFLLCSTFLTCDQQSQWASTQWKKGSDSALSPGWQSTRNFFPSLDFREIYMKKTPNLT